MIKHIVLWKLDDSYAPAEKDAIKIALQKKLLDLEEEISELLHIEVYFNSPKAAPKNFDILLDTVFNSMEDLAKYQTHAAHQKVVKYIQTLKLQRSAIDYNF